MKQYIAIDVGGTEIKYGLLDETGNIITKSAIKTPKHEGGSAILKSVTEIIEKAKDCEPLAGICISTAGVVDCATGEILYAGPTIPKFTGTSFKKTLEKHFSLPCEVENDVNCAGLAEYMSGAAQGGKCVCCLTVGTGIGGCAIIDGKVLHGSSGSAMEIGYLPIEDEEFQNIGSVSALSRRVAQQKNTDSEEWDGKRIFEMAKRGDSICMKAIEEMCSALAKGIASICYMLNPDIVVLGGGIMAQREYLEPILQKYLSIYLRSMMYRSMRLCFAEHGNDAGMIGAFYHFKALH